MKKTIILLMIVLFSFSACQGLVIERLELELDDKKGESCLNYYVSSKWTMGINQSSIYYYPTDDQKDGVIQVYTRENLDESDKEDFIDEQKHIYGMSIKDESNLTISSHDVTVLKGEINIKSDIYKHQSYLFYLSDRVVVFSFEVEKNRYQKEHEEFFDKFISKIEIKEEESIIKPTQTPVPTVSPKPTIEPTVQSTPEPIESAKPSPDPAEVQDTSSSESEIMVWIPTKGGTKYHISSDCSNMDSPICVTLEEAKTKGFTACKRCNPPK